METLTPNAVVEATKAEFGRAIDRLKNTLAKTPDDKLNWSPAPTARTPLQQGAHVAFANWGMVSWLKGEDTTDWSDIAAVDAGWREEEKTLATREQVMAKLDEGTAHYFGFLDSLTPEQLAGDFDMFGSVRKMADVITFPADHVRNHAAQLEYIQTCYGDMNWYMG